MNTAKNTMDQLEHKGKRRRSFLKTLWIGLGVVALAELIGVIYAYLRPRKQRIEDETFGSIITAGPADDFEKESVTAFRRGQFYLARFDDGGFLALSRKCTHLGCTVPWVESEKQFKCPCHSSAFNIKGEVLRSPAPRPLDIYAVFIENGIVKVDTNKKTKRSSFEQSQVVYF
jgi:cytochrome b6-f complex iron-sulfur subunit